MEANTPMVTGATANSPLPTFWIIIIIFIIVVVVFILVFYLLKFCDNGSLYTALLSN